MELPSAETTIHLASDESCTVLPPEGLSITQLFPSTQHEDTMAPPSVPTTTAPSHVIFCDLMEESKLSSKVRRFKYFIREVIECIRSL